MGIGTEETTEPERTGERIYVRGRIGEDETSQRHLDRYRRLARKLYPYVGLNADWLDIACGSGYGCGVVSSYFPSRYVGVDCSIDAIEYARKHWRRGEFVQADARQYENPGEFDAVLCIETLEHLPRRDQSAFLTRLIGLVRPGGRLGLSFPIGKGPSVNPYHEHEPSLEEILGFLRDAGQYVDLEVETGVDGTYGSFDQAFLVVG